MSADQGNNASDVTRWIWIPVEWHWWEVLQIILAIAGIIGNFLVMLVLFRVRRKLCSTDTLIAGLALADFLTSIFIIPHPRVKKLPDTIAAEIYCRIVHSSVLMWISICASIFTLTAISIERLTAVIRPVQFKNIFTPKRSLVIIGYIWFAALLVNIVVMFVVYYDDGACVFSFPSVWFHRFTGVMVFLIEYLIPATTMVVAHAFMIWTLWKRLRKNDKQREANRRITLMLLVVVVVFVICWTPDQIFYFALNIGLIDVSYLYSPQYRFYVVLAFINSCANPIIYATRNPNFRKALRELCGSTGRVGRIQNIFVDFETRRSQTVDRTTTGTKIDLSSSNML
ncbi:mu-type opioid receptor-like [Lytechinus variegatus]|uniref:mu-type opioid receptor-like n=1 Tax=Lytechinus variegatus TaxID=7654 RepID=UPI001BB1194B|nr:mu-type opioid receptor-like [Lytechinus variegatus]